MSVVPFTVHVSAETLNDLHDRLARTRWADDDRDEGWTRGTSRSYLKALIDYWYAGFDWPREEAALNRFPHFRADVDGFGVHFAYALIQGTRPGTLSAALSDSPVGLAS